MTVSTVVAVSRKGLSWQYSGRGEYFHLNPPARVGELIFNTNPQCPGEITGDCGTLTTKFDAGTMSCRWREIECLLNDNHQKGKMMIMIMKTSRSQVDSPVAEGKRKEGGGRKIRDLHRDT